MTYRQLAQLAGVSLSTVSKALSGSEEISEQTTERIRQLAIENGIKRPRYYRASQPLTVAIVVSDVVSRYMSQSVDIISKALWDYKIIPKVYICGGELSKYCTVLDAISNDGCLGIVSLFEKHRFSQKSELPCVHIPFTKMLYGAFSADNANCGVCQAVKYLKELGHTEIGYVGRKDSIPEFEGLKSILKLHGLKFKPEYAFRSKEAWWTNGEDAVRHYLSIQTMPTALISSLDNIAIDMINSFEKHGVQVPRDISIIGVGNTLCSNCVSNLLTTVEITIESTLVSLVNLFLKDIANSSDLPKTEYIVPQSTLIVRKTTGKPRANKKLDTVNN